MKDISLQFDKYLKIIKQNCKNSDSCLSLYHGQCKCEKLAEIWTLIESLIPPDCVKLDLSDFNGFVAGDDVSLPVNVIREAKATLGTYCWGDYKDCLLPTFNSNSVEALNASVMDERLSNGDCLIIHGDKLSKTVDNYGKVILSKKRTGKTLLSSIVLKEAIKRRLFPKNAALTFEYVTYQSLKFRTKQKDNPLVLDYRSCDWLVVDDIYLDKKGSEDSRSYSKDMIDSVILERIDQRLPTILIFQFNIDSFVGDEIQDMYGNGIYRIASNPKTFKISLSGGRLIIKEKMNIEEYIIYSLIKNEDDAVEEFLSSQIPYYEFYECHHNILRAVIKNSEDKVSTTKTNFKIFLSSLGLGKIELIAEEATFDRISTCANTTRDDLPSLLYKMKSNIVTSKNIKAFPRYNEEVQSDPMTAALNLSRSTRDSVDVISTPSMKFSIVGDEEFNKSYENELRERFKEKHVIKCGIEEIDCTMGIGFAPSTLTIVGADVGGFKSTWLLNVALGVYNTSNVDVLFVPLEMESSWVFDKIVSRETGINFDFLRNPVEFPSGKRRLSEESEQKVLDFVRNWKKNDKKFAFLDVGERTTVSRIRKQIEKNIEKIKPKLVVIDYVANLLADRPRKEGNSLEIGDMLKDMIAMGKPGMCTDEGFAVVSAAQLNRTALTRLKSQKDSSQQDLGSTDLMGSHQYSMDATNIFGLVKDKVLPNRKITMFKIKSRWGTTTFKDGASKVSLNIRPEISLIYGQSDASWGDSSVNDVLNVFSSNPTPPDGSTKDPVAVDNSNINNDPPPKTDDGWSF